MLSPGDIVMLTAAVRDLHLQYPGEFVTDVRTACRELWENNPFITPLADTCTDVEVIECQFPLIQQSNAKPYHVIHGFMQFLNSRLGVTITPSAFHGDIHLSQHEKQEPAIAGLIGNDVRYWLIVSGGKYDCTIKWWGSQRYQDVVDHFIDRIVFVQVGGAKHHHPVLKNVVDLRGKTSLRDLIRLTYFADGCVTPVSLLMHLAPAIEARYSWGVRRPCVVIAGGREPPHWEAYPTHAFLHTVGMLPCCKTGGCWRSRVKPLEDGSVKDSTERICVDVVEGLPRCMDMITSADVIKAVERYHECHEMLRSSQQVDIGVVGSTKPEQAKGDILFVTVADRRFLLGAIATCNSVKLFHPEARVVVVNNNKGSLGLSATQKTRFTENGIVVLDDTMFSRNGRRLGPWELKAYSAYDLAMWLEFKILIGIDSDCLLCSSIADVADTCLKSGKVAGGLDSVQHYDESYRIYGIKAPCSNRKYFSTSLYFCPKTNMTLSLLERWAHCCTNAAFNKTGVYPGHGDQGIFNAIVFGTTMGDGVIPLENNLWSQHWTYWKDRVVYDGDSMAFINRTCGNKRQRAFHCGGTHKFWDPKHRNALGGSLRKGQVCSYYWFLRMLFHRETPDTLSSVAEYDARAAALISDYLEHKGDIERLVVREVTKASVEA
jgi:ADP-heptose:LPS heptosyltransferase